MGFNTLVAFASFAFVASVTPGPNNVLLTATGSMVGFRRGVPTLLGITTGFAAMIFVLTLGLGSLVLDSPRVLLLLRIVGVLMLIWLSWQIAFSPVAPSSSQSGQAARPTGFVGAAVCSGLTPRHGLSLVPLFLPIWSQIIRQFNRQWSLPLYFSLQVLRVVYRGWRLDR